MITKLYELLRDKSPHLSFECVNNQLIVHDCNPTEPRTYILKLRATHENPELISGPMIEGYKKTILDICYKYDDCETCPHREGYCKTESSSCASFPVLKAWAEEMEAIEKKQSLEEKNEKDI